MFSEQAMKLIIAVIAGLVLFALFIIMLITSFFISLRSIEAPEMERSSKDYSAEFLRMTYV